jgi:integrase
VLEEFRKSEPAWYPMLAVLAFTGLRFAEVAALQHGDVDRANGVLRIRRGVVGTPKTERGHRTLVLPAGVLAALPCANEDPLAWLFGCVGRDGTVKPHSTGALGKPFGRVLKNLNLAGRATVHGLRRSFNSIALGVAQGELVRKALGHTDAAMTEHYLSLNVEALTKLSVDVDAKVYGTVLKPGLPETTEVLPN